MGVVFIIIQLVGMVGTLKENYCMMITYATFTLIIAGLNIAVAIWQLIFSVIQWCLIVVYVLISILTYSYAREIKNKLQEQNQTNIVFQHTILLHSTPGQSYPTPLLRPPAYESVQGGIQSKPVTSF